MNETILCNCTLNSFEMNRLKTKTNLLVTLTDDKPYITQRVLLDCLPVTD